MTATERVLILGSAPDVLRARDWEMAGVRLVTINNAWRVRPDWHAWIRPKDFPRERAPGRFLAGQRRVGHRAYVPAVNRFGGMVFCGGTMVFTAAYWALHTLRPQLIAFLGCDMIYSSSGPTHFYGKGSPDPLRPDPTLQSLEAKSARFAILAAEAGCSVVNLSDLPSSRLVFQRADRSVLAAAGVRPARFCREVSVQAREAEAALGNLAPNGKYWRRMAELDAAALARIDAMWLTAMEGLSAAA